MKNKLLIICGATATGKTQLASSLGKEFDAELVSADSRQIYKGLDILTGKDIGEKSVISMREFTVRFKKTFFGITPFKCNGLPIWLYDVVPIRSEFSVAHFRVLAHAVIDDVQKHDKLPIIVGGTGLYINALIGSIDTINIPRNQQLRSELEKLTVYHLGARLQKEDSQKWNVMNGSDKKNPRRLIRAIEVALSRKEQWSAQKFDGAYRKCTCSEQYDLCVIGLYAPRAILEKRIIERVESRWSGALEEVRIALDREVSEALLSTIALGSGAVIKFLHGELSKDKAVDLWAQQEFSYAKRQMTWFKKQPEIHWFDIAKKGFESDINELVMSWYT